MKEINGVKVEDFFMEHNLRNYPDAVLFDPNAVPEGEEAGGEEDVEPDFIARGDFLIDCRDGAHRYVPEKFRKELFRARVTLTTRGRTEIEYHGVTYTNPREFPKELKRLIRRNPDGWTEAEGVNAVCVNEFVYVIYIENTYTFQYNVQAIGVDFDVYNMNGDKLAEDMADVAEGMCALFPEPDGFPF